MICPRCGTQLPDDKNFCTECGAPISHTVNRDTARDDAYPGYEPGYGPQGYEQMTPPKRKKTNVGLIIGIAVPVFLVVVVIILAVIINSIRKEASKQMDEFNRAYDQFEESGMPKVPDVSDEIDIDSLNEAVKNIENLQLDTDINLDSKTSADSVSGDETDNASGGSSGETGGNFTKYSFADVTVAGNDITIVPNGGMNGSTVLYGGKDLDGFLDYVDDKVLEEGRTINRQALYDMLACMLVDKDLSSDIETIEKNLMMALAVTNNFFKTDLKIKECELDANNAAEYHYKVNLYDKDDNWVINYGEHTLFMNDGKTEYVSEMFKDEYLATWFFAIEDYYGIK